MENVADALKLAGAALLFVIAFSIAMVMFSRAKSTTDAVLDNLKLDDFLPSVEALPINTTRVVGIETIIPTIYRYCQSDANPTVRILNSAGEEIQVFDRAIESRIHNAGEVPQTSEEYDYLISLNTKYNDETKFAYTHGAPWQDQDIQYTLERINSFIYGIPAPHMPDLDYSRNNLMMYKDTSFEESYIEYRTSGKTYFDKDSEEELTILPASTHTIITYKAR